MKRQITYKKFAGLNEHCTQDDGNGFSPDMCNFCITADGKLKKRGGSVNMYTSEHEIDGMWTGYLGSDNIFVFAENGKLYKLNTSDCTTELIGNITSGKCSFFEFGGKLYILTGSEYYSFDGTLLTAVEGYAPILAHSCTPDGNGTLYESVNLLTRNRRQRFSSDGKSRVYKLCESQLANIISVKIDGTEADKGYICDLNAGTVTFTDSQIPEEGINNVEITYRKADSDRSAITSCRFAMLFGGNVDGRVFLYGNRQRECHRFHSELADGMPSAEYFPADNYTVIGNTGITSMVQQYDRQLIFTKDKAYYSLCEVRQNVQGVYYTSFPVYNLNGEKGCLVSGNACIIDNDPLTVCEDGVNRWVSTAVSNEKNAVVISQRISKSLLKALKNADYSKIKLFDRQSTREMFLVTSDSCFVYNYALGVWYRYSVIMPDFMIEYKGNTYYSQKNRILRIDENVAVDDADAIVAYWISPLSDLGEPCRRKNLDEISLTVECDIGSVLKIAVFDDTSKSTDDFITMISPPGTTVKAFRTHRKRISQVGIKLTADGFATDDTVCSISLISKTKGRNKRDVI